MAFFKFFGSRFGNIMQHCGPAQPKIIGIFCNIINHLYGMVKIILVAMPVNIFGTSQVNHLRKNNFQQSAFIQQVKTNRRFITQ